jgi:hypothetical protein
LHSKLQKGCRLDPRLYGTTDYIIVFIDVKRVSFAAGQTTYDYSWLGKANV